MSDLKPCPFCKAEPISENNRRFFLKHNPDCFLAHPMHNANCDLVSTGSIAKHIEAWNTRPAENALKAEVERLKKALRKIEHLTFMPRNRDKVLDMTWHIARAVLANNTDVPAKESDGR